MMVQVTLAAILGLVPSANWPATTTANATVALAILTGLLVVATVIAVFFGARAATSAAFTYRLESEPILTVRLIDGPNEGLLLGRIVPLEYIVCGTPRLADGVEIRPLTLGEARSAVGGSGMPRPSVLLEIQNVGRSPAVDLAIPFCVSVSLPSKERIQRQIQGDVAGDDDSNKNQVATNDVKILGIGAQTAAYLRVYNDFGIFVRVRVLGEASMMSLRGSKNPRRSVTVVSPEEFHIMDPTQFAAQKREAERRAAQGAQTSEPPSA